MTVAVTLASNEQKPCPVFTCCSTRWKQFVDFERRRDARAERRLIAA
jgi:hypothetical protein